MAGDVHDLLRSLTARLRPDARAVRTRVELWLDGHGAFGLVLERGRVALTPAPLRDPAVRIRTTAAVLEEIYRGRRAGYEAFLDGDLRVRGNLSVALELESYFEPATPRPPGWPEAVHLRAGRQHWAVLAAGPPGAPPVLLLHGLGATRASFLPTLRGLATRFRVYAADLPGFGNSGKPVAPYTYPWFAERVVELLDHLGIQRAGLVGNSLGGRIALEVALGYPARVRGVVCLCPALAFLRRRQWAPVVRLVRPELAMLPLRPPRSTVLTVLRGIFAHPDRLPDEWFEAAADEFFRVLRGARGRLAFAAAARQVYLDEPDGPQGLWRRLAGLEVPAAFLFGRHDPLIPPAFARHVARVAPSAWVEVLPGCGHVPQLEEPEATNELVASLLGDRRRVA